MSRPASTTKPRSARARLWHQRRAKGLCGDCGDQPAVQGIGRCQTCRDIMAEAQRERFGGRAWRPGSAGRPPVDADYEPSHDRILRFIRESGGELDRAAIYDAFEGIYKRKSIETVLCNLVKHGLLKREQTITYQVSNS